MKKKIDKNEIDRKNNNQKIDKESKKEHNNAFKQICIQDEAMKSKLSHVQNALIEEIRNYNKEMRWDNYAGHKAEPHILEESVAYLDDKNFMLEAVKVDAYCLKFASERLKNNKIIVKAANKSETFSEFTLEFVGEDLKKDKIFFKKLKNV